MPRKDISKISGKDELFKYHLNDITRRLRGKNVKVNAWVEFDPVFGWIHRVRVISINWPVLITLSQLNIQPRDIRFIVLNKFCLFLERKRNLVKKDFRFLIKKGESRKRDRRRVLRVILKLRNYHIFKDFIFNLDFHFDL
jgi:hypothetical protein